MTLLFIPYTVTVHSYTVFVTIVSQQVCIKVVKSTGLVKSCGTMQFIHLSWKRNTDTICKKITAGIFAIRRVKPLVEKERLISVYNAIVRPYLNYCCEVLRL